MKNNAIISIHISAAFLHYPINPWSIVYFLVAGIYHLSCFYVFAKQMVASSPKNQPVNSRISISKNRTLLSRMHNWSRSWIPSHCLGSLLAALPMLATFANIPVSQR